MKKIFLSIPISLPPPPWILNGDPLKFSFIVGHHDVCGSIPCFPCDQHTEAVLHQLSDPWTKVFFFFGGGGINMYFINVLTSDIGDIQLEN